MLGLVLAPVLGQEPRQAEDGDRVPRLRVLDADRDDRAVKPLRLRGLLELALDLRQRQRRGQIGGRRCVRGFEQRLGRLQVAGIPRQLAAQERDRRAGRLELGRALEEAPCTCTLVVRDLDRGSADQVLVVGICAVDERLHRRTRQADLLLGEVRRGLLPQERRRGCGDGALLVTAGRDEEHERGEAGRADENGGSRGDRGHSGEPRMPDRGSKRMCTPRRRTGQGRRREPFELRELGFPRWIPIISPFERLS